MHISPHQEYKRVATDDSVESLAEAPKSIWANLETTPILIAARIKIILLLIAFATLFVLVALVFTTRSNALLSAQQLPSTEHCGTSREEAISRGCTFDQLTATWLPASCSRKWEDEFLNTTGVGYYTEVHGIQPIDFSELPFNSTYHTNRVHHVAHCLFMFLRLGDRDSRLDGMTLSSRHQTHCVNLILREMEYSPRANIVKDPGRIKPGTCW
jgi:hypothetical protein